MLAWRRAAATSFSQNAPESFPYFGSKPVSCPYPAEIKAGRRLVGVTSSCSQNIILSWVRSRGIFSPGSTTPYHLVVANGCEVSEACSGSGASGSAVCATDGSAAESTRSRDKNRIGDFTGAISKCVLIGD